MIINRLTNLIYVAPERSNAEKYRILLDLIKCARNHRCINAVSVGINQVISIVHTKIYLGLIFILG